MFNKKTLRVGHDSQVTVMKSYQFVKSQQVDI